MRRLVVAIAAWTLLLCAAAEAAKLPVYRDPPSFKGRKSVPAFQVVEPPAPPAVKLSDTGLFPHEVVDDAGTAHVVWAEGRGDQDDAVYYCRLKRGATACDANAVLVWNKTYGAGDGPQYNIDNTGPRIVRVGDQLVVFSKRYPTGAERPDGTAGSSNVIAWTSNDGGTTWSDARLVGKLDMGQLVVLGSETDSTIINSAIDPLCGADGPAAWCLEIFRGGQFGTQSNLSTRSNDNYYPGIALDETGHPIAIAENLDGTLEMRRWLGTGDVGDPSQWTTSSAPLDNPSIAGGKAGVFMLDYAERYSGKFEVRRLNVGGDGVVAPGAGTQITDGSSQFGALGQDPSGGLHAAVTNTSSDKNGVYIHNSRNGGATFDPPTKLTDGQANGQLDVQAAEDGGGFVVYNHTGGVTSPGEIYAAGFGTQAPTNKAGLGNLGGGQGAANVTCQQVGFGKFDIKATTGCLYNGQGASSGLVVSTGEVTLDGLRIIPDPGTKIVIDPKKLSIETFGPVHVLASNAQTQVELWHGTIKRDLSKAVPGSTLFEFPSNEFKANVLGFDIAADTIVKLQADGVHIPVDLTLPPAFGGFTGHAELVSNNSGLKLDSLHIHIGPVYIGALTIDNVDVAYSAGDDRWTGDGKLTVPAGGSVEAHFVFEKGDFVSASFGYTPNPSITIGPFVYLLNINGGFTVKPLQIAAGATVGAGAAVNGTAPVSADGKFTMTFPTSGPADFKLTGTVRVVDMFALGTGFVDFQTDGYAAFGGHTGLDVGPLQLDADMEGFIDGPTGAFGADLRGKVGVCFEFDLPLKGNTRVCGSAKAEAAVNNYGFAVCGRIDPPDPFGPLIVSVEFPWKDIQPELLLVPNGLVAMLADHVHFSCHTEQYHTPPPRPIGARAAAAGQIVTVKSGLPSETIKVNGDGGAPDVTVTGPGGVSFSSKAPSKAGSVATLAGVPAAYVYLNKPRAGDYTITANDGSPGITTLQVSDGYTPAAVSAKVKRGRVAYRIAKLGHGQSVAFVEKGKFGSHVLATVAKARGTLRFKPAPGPGGKRTVIAQVRHDGVTTDSKRVGSFVAPPPPKPGAVRKLRAQHKTTTLVLKWKAAKNAFRYAVIVKGNKGSKVGRVVPARTKALKLVGMRRDEKFRVTVKALAKSGRAGPGRTAKTK